MPESVIKEDVMESLSEKINFLLKCLPKIEFHHTFTMNDVFDCNHISSINIDRIWVSSMIRGLILSNRSGKELLNLNFMPLLSGYHTVNKDGDFIYIGDDFKL